MNIQIITNKQVQIHNWYLYLCSAEPNTSYVSVKLWSCVKQQYVTPIILFTLMLTTIVVCAAIMSRGYWESWAVFPYYSIRSCLLMYPILHTSLPLCPFSKQWHCHCSLFKTSPPFVLSEIRVQYCIDINVFLKLFSLL